MEYESFSVITLAITDVSFIPKYQFYPIIHIQ